MEELIEKIRHHPDDDMDLVRRAYAFSEQAHHEQRRKSGDPHCPLCAVAVILADLMLTPPPSPPGCCTTAWRTWNASPPRPSAKCSGRRGTPADGVTKLSTQLPRARSSRRKPARMFLAMAKDIRVVLIKLADRLHNMRTLSIGRRSGRCTHRPRDPDIYAPLAHRLGVYTTKGMEDLALRYIDPDGYDLVLRRGHAPRGAGKLIALLDAAVAGQPAQDRHQGRDRRPKHFYSIYKKMKSQNKTSTRSTT